MTSATTGHTPRPLITSGRVALAGLALVIVGLALLVTHAASDLVVGLLMVPGIYAVVGGTGVWLNRDFPH